MKESANEKIHPYLKASLETFRIRIVLEHIRATLRFELSGERIEESEYDEQERLRRRRLINRKLFRGEMRYTDLVARLEQEGAAPAEIEAALCAQFDNALKSASAPIALATDLSASVQRYRGLLPPEEWPVVLSMAPAVGELGRLRRRLGSLGLPLLPTEALERFGILKFRCPPEMNFLVEIACLPEVLSLADPATPISPPSPIPAALGMGAARSILGIDEEMMDRYGDGVTLAILDTGIDPTHPGFARLRPADYRNFTSVEDHDVNGHGTHVASVAAGAEGEYSGVCPKCRLVVGKVISGGQIGNLESILNGMSWAVFEQKADVITLSIGDLEAQPNGRSIWTSACDEAFNHGTIVCVAAGNNNDPFLPESIVVPGDSSTAITVGAIDGQRRLAAFSAQGSTDSKSPLFGKPNCVGPGINIVGARSSYAKHSLPQGDDPFHVAMTGTSAAAASIAGCLALLKSKGRMLGWQMTPADVADVFYSACEGFNSESGEGYRNDIEIGRGLVDMQKAFRILEARSGIKQSRVAVEHSTRDPLKSDSPGTVKLPGPTVTAQKWEMDLCYACAQHYLTKIGLFSPVWKCNSCGAPICKVCWDIGHRRCASDLQSGVASVDNGPLASAEAGKDPSQEGAGILAYPAEPEHSSSINSSDAANQNPTSITDSQWGETFFNRFDWKVRSTKEVIQPLSGNKFRITANLEAQEFRRSFGQVKQFPLRSGFRKVREMCLTAVCLTAAPLAGSETSQSPTEDILKQLSGPTGLDFQDGTFYVVGIFSPVGWPLERKKHAEIRGNAVFYLVEKKKDGRPWGIFGPEYSIKEFFNPETDDEQKMRAEVALQDNPELAVPGEQIETNGFLDDYELDRKVVEDVIRESGGRFQLIKHKGKSHIQRMC